MRAQGRTQLAVRRAMAALLALALSPSEAAAQAEQPLTEQGSITRTGQQEIVVNLPEASALYQQLRLEFEARGWQIRPRAAGSASAPTVELQISGGVAPTLRVLRDGQLVALDSVSLDLNPRTLSLRAAELLRAVLSAPALAPRAPRRAPPLPTPPPPRPRPRRLWIGSDALALTSPGGVGHQAGLQGRLRVAVHPNWAVRSFVLVPLFVSDVVGPQGTAEVRPTLFGTGPMFSARLGSNFQWHTGIGGGASVVMMRGRSAPPFPDRDDTATAAIGFGTIGLSYALHSMVRLEAGLLFGGAFPEIEVRFADAQVATWGRPFGAFTMGLSLSPL